MQLFWGEKSGTGELTIMGDDLRHLTKSLRKQVGDPVTCINGTGYLLSGPITQIDKNQAIVKLDEEVLQPKSWAGQLHIAIALTKNIDRIEWFVEKVTEMGIDRVSFMNCERSVKTRLRMDRIIRLTQSAMKQCQNPYMPHFQTADLEEIIKETSSETIKLIPTCETMDKKTLFSSLQPGKNITILIGPEGDFTPGEITLAINHGFRPVSLGSSRLRTETAGMMVCAVVHAINE